MNKTKIIADEGKQELFIIREFEADRGTVFKAFADPDILKQWFAPFDTTMHYHHQDYKTFGSYSWYHVNKNGETVCTFNGAIHEISFPDRIIQTSEFMELPEKGYVVLETITFEEIDKARTKVIIQDVCISVKDRDAMIESGMEAGLVENFNNLDSLLKIAK